MTKLLLAVATMALLVIAGGVSILVARSTFASIPDQAGVIHACYSNFGSPQGSLRVIDTASSFPYGSASCKPGETPITWNQTGTPGAAGAPGFSGYEIVQSHISFAFGGTAGDYSPSVDCPTGKNVFGGGGFANLQVGAFTEGLDLTASHPDHSAGRDNWVVTFARRDGSIIPEGAQLDGTIYAACAFATTTP